MSDTKGLSGNQLKIIALISMTLDHIGVQLLPQCEVLRILGRLAFPIFAYLIAEGCRYTKNRKKYLGRILLVAALCQAVYFGVLRSYAQCIFVTFSLSIILIYLFDYVKTKQNAAAFCIFAVAVIGAYFISEHLPQMLKKTNFSIDYGFYGVIIPFLVYTGISKTEKLCLLGLGLIALSIMSGGVQWYSIAALPLIAFYNGERGRVRIKNLFYIYYPAHIAAIYLIGLL